MAMVAVHDDMFTDDVIADPCKVLDRDIHIIEPPDLWQRYIDAEFRAQAPYSLTEDAGDLRVASTGDASRRRQGHDSAHTQERWRPFEERGWTSKAQLDAIDTEGIDVAVNYPSRGLFALTVPDMEPRFAAARARAYNNRLYDFCQENPDRLLGAGMIAPFAVEDAMTGTRRGVFLRPNEVNGRNWHDLSYAPRLRVAFLEGNCSWLPFLLWRLDDHWERQGDGDATELTMAPSVYSRRQCFAAVACDETPVKSVIDARGDDRLVFSTDFPHGEAKFPRAVESFLQLPILEDSKRKSLWDNCATYYGLTT